MRDEKKGHDARPKFYNTGSVVRHIKIFGIPRRTGLLREMVATGSAVKLATKEGSDLIETLGHVMFVKHPRQIAITDSTNGELIATITT